MKLKKYLLFCLIFTVVTGCNRYSADYLTTRNFLSANGSWRVYKYKDNGTNKTKNMNGYKLVFSPNNVLTYSSGDNSYNGYWNTSESNDRKGVLSLGFYADNEMQDISDSWVVTKQRPGKIWLESKNVAIGEDDVLILKKN